MPQSTAKYTRHDRAAANFREVPASLNQDPGDHGEPSWGRPQEQLRRDEPPLSFGPANRRAAPGPGEPVTEHRPDHADSESGRRWTLGILGIAGASSLVGAVVGGLIVVVLVGEDSAPDTEAGTVARPVSVELTSAVTDVANAARPGVVRVESAAAQSGDDTDIGSGVVIDAEGGYILTNAHVVLETERLQVVLADGTVRPAVLVGHDFPYTDVAVLQVSPGGLTEVPLGDSELLRLGETVIAIGNPLAEFDGSVTVGVVSGLNRARTYDGVRQGDLIQTDAAVNSGNSGGALLNLQGQLVGIPMSVLRESRGGAPVEGIAFALPINRAEEIASQIIESGGAIQRPTLGLDVVEITAGVRAQFPGLAAEGGAVVISIHMNGAGAKAGIQLADVIVEVDGLPVDSEHPLHSVLARLEAGQSVQVVFNRDGRIIETEVTLAKRS